MEPVDSDWSAVPQDLLVGVAMYMLSAPVEDYMAFRGVCTSWRNAAVAAAATASDDRFVKSWPSVPLLMLAEKEGSEDEREFYSLSKRKICMRLPLPEAKGKRCLEARFGWLLTLASSGEVNLLNPFSSPPAQIKLPNFKTFPEYSSGHAIVFIRRAVLSANPSHESDFVLVVLTYHYLGFWRYGDENWTRIESRWGAFQDVNYHKLNRKFYAVSFSGVIWVWDPELPAGADLTVAHAIVRVERDEVGTGEWEAYLVESSAAGELLLVMRDGQQSCENYTYGATKFRVFRIDVTKGEWGEIRSLGEDVIFVGQNAAISINAAAAAAAAAASDDHLLKYVIKPNCIYFSDDSIDAYDFGLPEEETESESEDDDDMEQDSEDDDDDDDEDDYIAREEKQDRDVIWERWEAEDGAVTWKRRTGTGHDGERRITCSTDALRGRGDDDVGVVWEKEEDRDAIWVRWETHEGEVIWRRDRGHKWRRGRLDATKGGGKDMGVYNLEDKSIQRFGDVAETLSFTSPPLWLAPSSFSSCLR